MHGMCLCVYVSKLPLISLKRPLGASKISYKVVLLQLVILDLKCLKSNNKDSFEKSMSKEMVRDVRGGNKFLSGCQAINSVSRQTEKGSVRDRARILTHNAYTQGNQNPAGRSGSSDELKVLGFFLNVFVF